MSLREYRHLPLVVLLLVVFVLSLIPTIETRVIAGSSWRGVPPALVSDSLYYYARAKEVFDGFPFIGNPYFLEYQKTISPSFFVPDWLYALPLLVGAPLVATIAFNFTLWSLVFAILTYFIFRLLRLSQFSRVVGSVLVYMQVYSLILRPVSMQQVFPFFFLFLIAVILWLRDPLNEKYSALLACAVAAPFYLYAYLWQVVVVISALIGARTIFRGNVPEITRIMVIGCCAVILAFPALFVTFKQIASPYYWETMERIGLVVTHLPTLYTLYYLRWIVIVVLLALALRMFGRKEAVAYCDESKELLLLFSLTGMGLAVVSLSTIVTGRELEVATHIGRFIMLWLALGFVVCADFIIRHRTAIMAFKKYKMIVVCVLLVVCAVGIGRNIPRSIPQMTGTDIVSIQRYAAPLAWLERNAQTPTVIFANESFSSYVPLLTKHYVLFASAGKLHLAPSSNIEERYLVSRYFDDIFLSDIKKDFLIYAGVGDAEHRVDARNEKVTLCRLLRVTLLGRDCGKMTNAISLKGEEYFKNLDNEYLSMRSNIRGELVKYHVEYIAKDKVVNRSWNPGTVPGATAVYEDDNFVIFRLQ